MLVAVLPGLFSMASQAPRHPKSSTSDHTLSTKWILSYVSHHSPYLLDIILVAVEEMPPFDAALLLLCVLFVILIFSSFRNSFRFSLERSL